ncbi:hypothetical protein WN51_12870 [Melipona quadrifasciata]|uniref:Uncharacterized protein n=1 Tax=Melipona quadrifasciata TaxID=166423 RepID=A0A0N0U5V0_9HYME|nr:hypothetical protein WN51_12870 [Melipona quadrifasciata]
MRENVEIRRLIENEWITICFRKNAKGFEQRQREKIAEVQAQNRKSYDKKRKEATRYRQGNMVAIKQRQTSPGLKLYPKFLEYVYAQDCMSIYEIQLFSKECRPVLIWNIRLSWNVSPENLGHMAALSPKQETNNALDRGLMHGANFPEHATLRKCIGLPTRHHRTDTKAQFLESLH